MFCCIICTDSLSPDPSASMVETEETPENTTRDPDDPEPVDGHTQMEYGILLWLDAQSKYSGSNKVLTHKNLS